MLLKDGSGFIVDSGIIGLQIEDMIDT